MSKEGVCKYCGQARLLDETEAMGKTQEEMDELASYECECEGAETHRDVVDNKRFEQFARTTVRDFMEEHGLKRIQVNDDRGNKSDLLRMEKGDIKISTTLKEFLA